MGIYYKNYSKKTPIGYKDLEYIESSGSQYVSIAVGSANVDFVIDCILYYTSNYPRLLKFSSGYNVEVKSDNTSLYFGSQWQVGGTITGKRCTCKKVGNTFYYDNGTLKNSTTYSTSANGTLLLFAETTSLNNPSKTRMYSMKITKTSDSTLLFDLIPALRESDNKAGLYDLVNNKFYASATSTALVAGTVCAITPIIMKSGLSGYKVLEYITSTGSQYIKTGVYLTKKGYKATVAYKITGSASDQCMFGVYFDGSAYSYRCGNTNNNNFTSTTSNGIVTAVGSVTTSYNSSYQFMIFAKQRYDNGTVDSKATGNLYSCKIWDGNTLIRDYIPVQRLSDGAVGLYDIVNKTFSVSAEGTAFKAGTVLSNKLQGIYLGSKRII